MNKTLRILSKTTQIDVIKQPHCFIGQRNIQKVTVDKVYFKNYDILINAGGFDVKGMIGDLSSISSATPLLGGGRNIPKIGEERYSDINPGIDDF
ncbi:MAG: hypothetical protein V3W20_09060 [Candidatus Neomarinimicrobiota bacterium]